METRRASVNGRAHQTVPEPIAEQRQRAASSVCDRAAFTLVELLLALGAIGLLAAIAFPVFHRVRDAGNSSSCQSNLRQLGVAMAAYAQDNGDKFVPLYGTKTYQFAAPPGCPNTGSYTVYWGDLLFTYLNHTQPFQCPSFEGYEKVKQPPHALYWDDCPPGVGGGGTTVGVGGGSPCPPPPPPPPPDVDNYSYALNAMLPDSRAWRYSPGIRNGARGFIAAQAEGTCNLSRSGKSGIGAGAVADPTNTFVLVEAVEKDKNGIGVSEPEFSMDTQLDYAYNQPIGDALPPNTVVSSHHRGYFHVLYADWHVKAVKFGTSKPVAWSVQSD